jgi:uncharacterized protein
VFFLPKSDQFFEQLQQLAQCGANAIQHLQPRLTTGEPQLAIQDVKQTAKKTIEQLTDAVCRTFVTPFDREDLQAFAFYLYRILKITDKINQRYGYRPIQAELYTKQLHIITQQSQHMVALVQQMTKSLNTKGVKEKVQLISDLEHQADIDYHDRLAAIYSAPPFADVRDFVLTKDLLQHFDKVADTYRDAANLALQIVLKHS